MEQVQSLNPSPDAMLVVALLLTYGLWIIDIPMTCKHPRNVEPQALLRA